jgi:translation initiation factor 2B subunit (eIF-2B alpha/beta/delta family)
LLTPIARDFFGEEIHSLQLLRFAIYCPASLKNFTRGGGRMSVKAVREFSPDVSADDFHSLEEKVYRTIELLKAAREAKAAAERDAVRLREQLELREEEMESMRREAISLRKEREEVRARVEKMLRQIDELTAEESGA